MRLETGALGSGGAGIGAALDGPSDLDRTLKRVPWPGPALGGSEGGCDRERIGYCFPGNVLPVVGAAAVGSIKTVQTKLVSVFATRFLPDLDTETSSVFLQRKTWPVKSILKRLRLSTADSAPLKYLLNAMRLMKCAPLSCGHTGRYYEPCKVGVIGSDPDLTALCLLVLWALFNCHGLRVGRMTGIKLHGG